MADLADRDVVIVEAVRTPLGRRNGGLATVHAADLLADVQRAAIARAGIDPHDVGQIVGGCVSQVGEQTFNIARTAWLTAGLPLEVAATTVDAQCGSSQQATNLAASMVRSGVVDVALGVRHRVDEPRAARRRSARRVRPADSEDVLRALRGDEPVRRCRTHRREVGHHACRLRPVRPRVAATRAARLGRGSFRARGRARRRPRSRRRRQAGRDDTSSRPRRRPARDIARSVGEAEAGRSRERCAHGRHVVADHRRGGGCADDDRVTRPRAGEQAARASSTSASSASTRY